MTDLAVLGIKIESTDTKVAIDRLHNLADAGGKAEKATDGVGAAHRKAAGDVTTASQAADKLTAGWVSMTGAVGVLTGALAALGLTAIAGAALEANKEMQSLQASMKIATGSTEAAAAQMDKLKKFAAETPFALEQSVSAFLKLKNLGLDPSIEAMRSYGNTSASMGKDLMQMIEAVADASTGEFERLKEFGIKASQEKDKVSFTFQGVTTTVKNSSDEIQNYLRAIGDTQFAGSMGAQMETLNGQFANLEDAVAAAFISFGEGGFNQALSEAVSSMTGVAEGATSTAAQLGAMAGEAIRFGAAIAEAVGPALMFLAQNLGTIIDLAAAAAAGFLAFRAAMAVTEAFRFVQAMLEVQKAVFGATTAQAAAAVASRGLQVAMVGAATAARGFFVALGPLTIALTAAMLAYEAMHGEVELAGVANVEYTATQKAASEAVNTAQQLQLDLAGATGEARKAIIEKIAATRASVIADGLAAVAAYRRSQQELLLAQTIANRKAQEAGVYESMGGMGALVSRLTGVRSAAQDAAQRVADLKADVNALGSSIVDSDKALQVLNRSLASAAAGSVKLDKATSNAGDAARKAKEKVDPFIKALSDLEKSVNATERELEKLFKREEPEEGPLDFIEKGAREAEKLIETLDALSDDKYRFQMFKNEEAREATREMLDNLDAIANRAADVGQIMRDAFGGIGGVFGNLIANMADYRSEYERMLAQVKAGTRTQISMDAELAGMQARNTSQLIGGVKSLFKEKSAAYKAMDAIEKVHAALQFANMVKALAMDAVRTTTEVASSGVRATAKGAEGAATIFAALGPFGFPVVAAMVAVLAAMGVKGLSGGGGGGAVKPPSAEDVQAAIGTGTVLGDNSAQSDSIAKALDIIASNTNEDLEYSNESVRYLRSIASGIQDLAGLVSRQIGLGGGMFDTAGLGLGQSSKNSLGGSGILGAVGAILFGKTTTTRTLFDQGLELFQTSVGEALMQGVNAQAYAIVEQVKKKSGFLGIGGGTKTTYETSTGTVSTAIEQQFQLIIDDITKSVVAFGDQLGIDVSEQVKRVMLPAAKLSFLDMSGEEIQDALEAYFSSVADIIATTLNSDGLDLNALQKVGEGLYETLARVVRTLTTVNVSLSSIGMGPLSVGGNSGANVTAPAADNLVGLFGGLDAFRDAINQFSEDFLTDAERMAPVINAVQREMARLGLAGVTTNDQFKQLVLGLDLGTESGQEMFASLMAVAPAFAKVNEYLASLNGELGSTGKTAAELAAIAKQSRSLDIQLMEALGNAAGALAAKRADELAAMDESLRAKQQEVWAAQDAAQATREATALAKTQRQMEIQIMELQGDASGALAARRAIELASIDETLRPLQERIYALEDEKNAQDEANAALKAAQTLASDRRALEIQIMELTGDAAGALAARRADELAALDPSLRALQERIYALEDERTAVEAAAEAARNAREIAKTGRDMEIRIMELFGDAAGALAARRAEELAALDPSLRGLQLRIYALEDEKTASDALTEALRTEQELTKTRRSMEIELMRALGDESGALAAQRELELAALDPSLHALQRAIWTAQDATKAQNDLADAQSEAARTAQAMANLNIRLLEAQGNDTAALAARRQLELSQATDDATRAILLEIYAAEDLAKVKAKEADAARQAIQDAQEAARAAAEIAKQRTSLEIQLMRLTGNEAAATAAQRELELAAMDESLRALQLQVWAAEDAKAAVEAHAKAVSDARDVLSQAYERESEALKDTIERFSGFSASLREFRATLYDGANGIGDLYRQTQAIFVDTAAAARMGDADALGKLAGVSKEFLDASRGRASSLIEYQRDVARVARAVDAGITASDEVVDYAQAQLDALNESVKGILDVNETLTSTHDALIAYLRVTSGQVLAPASTPIPVPPVTAPAPAPVAAQPGSASSEDINGLVEEFRTLSIPQVAALNKLLRIAERWDGDGMPIRNNDAGDNLSVEVTA